MFNYNIAWLLSTIVIVDKAFFRKKYNQIKRWFRKKNSAPIMLGILLILSLMIYAIYMTQRRLTVNQETYRPLMNLIAKAESRDNYNAYFGNANNSAIKFTNMTVAEVLDWQKQYVAQGAASSAVGRYQIINTTLAGLIEEHKIDTNRKFDESLQDELAISLLNRRGGEKYVNQELTQKEFASQLAMEWAGLPRVIGDNPEASYYDGDGLNKSLVKVADVLQAVEVVSAD